MICLLVFVLAEAKFGMSEEERAANKAAQAERKSLAKADKEARKAARADKAAADTTAN